VGEDEDEEEGEGEGEGGSASGVGMMGAGLSLAIPESTSIILWVADAFNVDSRACFLSGSDFMSCERSVAWLRFVGKGTLDRLRRSSDACLAKAA
jgi:hypothetical protein